MKIQHPVWPMRINVLSPSRRRQVAELAWLLRTARQAGDRRPRAVILAPATARLPGIAEAITEPPDLPDLLSTAEAADLMAVHVNTVKNMISDGRLPAVRVGRNWKVRREDVLALIPEGEAGQ